MFHWSLLLLLLVSSTQAIQFDSNAAKTNFVIFPRLFLCQNGSFSLEFRTTTINGLIFYTTDPFRSDSLLVSISRGKLFISQKFGKSHSSQEFEQSVNDDRWYKIAFKRRSAVLSEIVLYSVALRNVESRLLKSKVLNYLPFTHSNTSSTVYIGGLPREHLSSEYLFPSFQGFIRNLRYGLCGCPERIQHPLFSSLASQTPSEVCEQQLSLCSSSACECLNVDEEPRYQCDCSNKTCQIPASLNANLLRFDLDFSSVEYRALSDAISFAYGSGTHRFNVIKTGAVLLDRATIHSFRSLAESRAKTNDQLSSLTFSPLAGQRESCMWDLNRCSTEFTLTLVLSLERFNRSTLLFTQDLRRGAALHVTYLVLNDSSSSLQFDLWLPRNRGLLRTQLMAFPRESPLFINVVFRSPSSLAVFLFGQLVSSTTRAVPMPSPKSSTLSFKTFVRFRSISWSYDQSLSDCCAFERSKRDLDDLETCQSVAILSLAAHSN